MSLPRFTVTLDPPNPPLVTIDGEPLPPGVVQGIALEQASGNDLPQLVLVMAGGPVTVSGSGLVNAAAPPDAAGIRAFLAQVDVMALSEAAAALQGGPDPQNPGRYLDSPTAAFLAALGGMCGDPS